MKNLPTQVNSGRGKRWRPHEPLRWGRRGARWWGGLTPRGWVSLAVGLFLLLAVAVPGIAWLTSPRAGVPAFPGFAGDATPLVGSPEPTRSPEEAREPRAASQVQTPPSPSAAAARPSPSATVASSPVREAPRKGEMSWPVEGRVLRGYGFGYSEVYGDWRLHPGIDLATRRGETVGAVAAGRVQRVERDQGGYRLEVEHGGGVLTVCAPLEKVLVRTGEWLRPGQAIGVAASEELRLEVRVDGESQDPLAWLQPR